MKTKFAVLLTLLIAGSSLADVWKWDDANGKTHFVDTNTAIFTWLDDDDKINYGDTPDHEDAVAVQLVWHSAGTLNDIANAAAIESADDETSEEELAEKAASAAAAAYYCKKATENYQAYKGAPRLYRTNDAGEREYLSKTQAARTLRESKAEMKQYCS